MIPRLLVALSFGLACAADLAAQRPRPRPGGGRDGQPPAAQPQPATPTPEARPTKVEKWTAIVGGDIHLGTGEVLRRATVLIGDDRIHAVGHNLELPEGTTSIDATGRVVCPGFVAVKLSGVGVPAGAPSPVVDAANPFDPTMKLGLAAGITSYLSLSGGGGNAPSGSSAIVKLAYGNLKDMVAAEDVVQVMSVPLDPQAMRQFKELVKKAREWQDRPQPAAGAPAAPAPAGAPQGPPQRGPQPAPGQGAPGGPAAAAGRPPQGTEAILKILDGKVRLWITSRRIYDNEAIAQAMEIATALGVGVVLDRPVTAWSMPDAIAATGSMAIVGPRDMHAADPTRPETTGSNLAQSAILVGAGVPVAVTPTPGSFGGGPVLGTGGILGHDLNTPHIDAAYAVRGGLDNRRALRTLTLDAARIVNADKRLGSIEPGKDADILILDGDPLHYATFVQVAIVSGKVVYEKARESLYDHIRR